MRYAMYMYICCILVGIYCLLEFSNKPSYHIISYDIYSYRCFSRRWLFNKYIFNCILLSIDIHNAYICIQNSIGMFQVGVERWFVLSIETIWKKVFFLRLIKDKKLISFVLFQRFNAFWQSFKFLKQLWNIVRIS